MDLMYRLLYKLYLSLRGRIGSVKVSGYMKKFDIHPSVNFFQPLNITLKGHIEIDEGTYMNSGMLLSGSKSKIQIGKYCAIGNNVTISSITHSIKQPTGENILHEEADIKIGQHVWIGSNVFITKGVVIADFAIIGANSFVNKSVKAYNIVGGVPAKFIKTYRRD
jgi:maltose O-acetyltransferase